MKIIDDNGVEREVASLEELDEFKTLKDEKTKIEEDYSKLSKKEMDFGKFQKKSDDEIAKMGTAQLQAYREKELAEERAKGLETEISNIKNQNKQYVVNSTLAQFGLSAEQVELVKKNMSIIANDTERGINEETPEGIFKKAELAVNMLGIPKQDFSTSGSYSSTLPFASPVKQSWIDSEDGKGMSEKLLNMAGNVNTEIN